MARRSAAIGCTSAIHVRALKRKRASPARRPAHEALAMTATLGLFDGPAPRLRAAPASAPFLDVLADAMVAALGRDDPFALSDALVLLPNRRAARGLMDAFA